MPTAIKSPKFILFWLGLLLLLLPVSPNAKLQASFAPPIEPAQYQAHKSQPAKAKKYKKPRPNNSPNPRGKRILGGLLIGLFGSYSIMTTIYGAFVGLIASIWATGGLSVFFIVLGYIAVGLTLTVLPAIIYAALLIDNSYLTHLGYTPSLWPRLRREYIWGILTSLIYGLGAIFLLTVSYLSGASLVAVAVFILLLVASALLFGFNVRNYRRDKPTSRIPQQPNNPDEYK